MNIDWSLLITKTMKAAAAAEGRLTDAQALLRSRNEAAAVQVARIQDRIETLGYGIDLGEATTEDEVEQQALLGSLRQWKAYKFSLGKVSTQAAWPVAPEWPVQPVVPVIMVDPTLPTDSLM